MPGKEQMTTKKITSEEIRNMRVSSLPARPASPAPFGGGGYSAREVKAAFDRLPLYVIEKFNSLIDDLTALGEGSLIASMPTGISDGHTIADLIEDVKSGNFATYLNVDGRTLSAEIAAIWAKIGEMEARS